VRSAGRAFPPPHPPPAAESPRCPLGLSLCQDTGSSFPPIDVLYPVQIERAVAEFARKPNGGLIVIAGGLTIVHRKLIIALAAQHRLPAVYWNRMYVADGGLISYGPDTIDQYRRAALGTPRGHSPSSAP
jgi:hypothetical protein